MQTQTQTLQHCWNACTIIIKKKVDTIAHVCYSVHTQTNIEGTTMQYAIINFATQQTTFFATFAQASAACTAYNSSNMSSVYIVDLQENAIEKL